jgi:DNA-binding transcriptional MerR regulator
MTSKSATAFRTISEVSEELEIPQHVLRFWETRFAHLKPLKRAGGRRYYRPEDVELLKRIRDLLYRQGMTIRGVQQVLRAERRGGRGQAAGEGPPANAAVAGDPLVQELYALRDELVALRRLIARGS